LLDVVLIFGCNDQIFIKVISPRKHYKMNKFSFQSYMSWTKSLLKRPSAF